MSFNENRVEQLRRELTRLRERAARASGTIADERKKAADYRARATRTKSPDMYLRQAATAESKALRAEKERAWIDAETARKEKSLYDAQAAVDKERARAAERRTRSLEDTLAAMYRPPALPSGADEATTVRPRRWDFFISHASPDKDSVVRPLADALIARGADVWYDEFELTVGDSLRAKIDEGLAESTYGVVVLTSAYLAGRPWTENELNGLFAANKRILPIWHNVSHDEVARYSPMLADRVALSTALLPLSTIVDKLMELIATDDSDAH